MKTVKHQPCTRDYENYYLNQCGYGSPVFGGVRVQKGHGLGNILGGIFRAAMPLIKSGAKSLGKKALQTGYKVAGDVVRGENIKQSVKKRSMETLGIVQQPRKRVRVGTPKRGRGRNRGRGRGRGRSQISGKDIFG